MVRGEGRGEESKGWHMQRICEAKKERLRRYIKTASQAQEKTLQYSVNGQRQRVDFTAAPGSWTLWTASPPLILSMDICQRGGKAPPVLVAPTSC